MSRAMRFCGCALLLTAAVWASGCASLDLERPNVWPFSKEDDPRVPTKLVAIWTDAVSTSPDASAARGFGGRLTFYDGKTNKPVKVDGTLVVYLFDEEGRDPGNAKPDRKYVFNKEDWSKHYSKSELGHSYSIWVPYDEVGGPQKEISLIVRFAPTAGPTVVGEQTKQVLPGAKAVAKDEGSKPGAAHPAGPANAEGRVALASHEEAVGESRPGAADAASSRRMMTTTIRVPPGNGRTVPVAEVRPESTRREPAGLSSTGSWTPLPPVDPASPVALSPQAHSSPDARPAPEAQPVRPGCDRGSWPPRPGESSYHPGHPPLRDQRRESWSSAPAEPSGLSRPGWERAAEAQTPREDSYGVR
jgi:hypothetical protein